MARGALEVHTHEHLGDVLGRLHLGCLARIDNSAPDDAFGEPFRAGSSLNELGHELVVCQVGEQRRVKPSGDLFSSAIDVAGAFVIIPEQIVPETQPMLRIIAVPTQQARSQSFPFVTAFVRDKFRQLCWRRQLPSEVQVNPTGEPAIADCWQRFDPVLYEILLQKPINRIRGFGPRRNRWQARLEIEWFEAPKAEPFRPQYTLIDPGAQDADLRRCQTRPFL